MHSRTRSLLLGSALLAVSGCVDALQPPAGRLFGRVTQVSADRVQLGNDTMQVILTTRRDSPFQLVLSDAAAGVTYRRGLRYQDVAVGDSVMAVFGDGAWLLSDPPIPPIRRVLVYRGR